jgi:hypothetical protein
MATRVTYSIVDCVDGRFAVVAVSASGATYRRAGLLTLAEAEACVDDLRVALAGCGVALVRLDGPAGTPEAG